MGLTPSYRPVEMTVRDAATQVYESMSLASVGFR